MGVKSSPGTKAESEEPPAGEVIAPTGVSTSSAPLMAATKTKKKGKRGEIPKCVAVPSQSYFYAYSNSFVHARPRQIILPPEIIRMILQYLETDKETIRACSKTARNFRHVALSFLGRHITVNDISKSWKVC